MDLQEIVMGLIVNGGNAKSKAIEAIHFAKEGDLEKAKEKLEEAGKDLSEAHEIQTELIQNEATGKSIELSLLLVHAQDHLMNAITVKDLATEFVDMYSIFKK